jgi:hypothetical protein
VAYTRSVLASMRKVIAEELLEEHRQRTGNPNASMDAAVDWRLVEDRLKTEIIAGIGDSKSATTSPEVASIAAQYMSHEDPNVRKLAASALTQREPE